MSRRIWSALAAATLLVGIWVAWSWLDRRGAPAQGVAPTNAPGGREAVGEWGTDPTRAQERREIPVVDEDAQPGSGDEGRADPVERELPAGGLLVEVVDAQGRPAPGVSVEFVCILQGRGVEQLTTATSRTPDGLAHLDLAPIREFRARIYGLSLGGEPALQADIASAEPVRHALSGWPADGDRARLELPPVGALHVRLLDGAGTALDAGRVAWFWLPADVAVADPGAAYERVGRHVVDVREGAARIEPVGLGLTFQLSASAPGLGAVAPRGIEGPRAAGEVRTLDVRLGPVLATLRLRVLDLAGAPLASASLWAELWVDPERVPHPHAGPPRPHGFALATDAEGWASIPRAPGSLPVAPRLDLCLRSRDRDAQEDPLWSFASLSLPTTLAEGEVVVLGDVGLQRVPVLLAGTVVDPTGEPIPHARLDFRERHGEGPEHRWYNLDEGRLRADAQGRFRLRGARPPRALGLWVRAEGFEVAELEDLPIGALDQLVVLERSGPPPPSGTLRVEVVLDEGIPFLELLLRLQARGGRSRTPDWLPGRELAFDRLVPGIYDVSIETREGGLELGRIEGVEVLAAKVAADPRLMPFDLRGTARAVTLRVVRPDGTPWRRAQLVLVPEALDSQVRLRTDDEGLATCVLPRSIARARIGGPDREPVLVDLGAAGGSLRVELAE